MLEVILDPRFGSVLLSAHVSGLLLLCNWFNASDASEYNECILVYWIF